MSEDGRYSSDVYQEYSEFYDLYVGDRQVDLPMYKGYAAKSGTPILEIGAGSGIDTSRSRRSTLSTRAP